MSLRPVFLALCALLLSPLVAADFTPADEQRARAVTGSPAFRAVVAAFERDYERFVAQLIQLNEIPAPPFGEKARGEAFAKLLADAGLTGITTDAEGNVIALRRGRGTAPLLCVAAHLDTVFPAGTDVKVKRQGNRLIAPGVGDDTRGLAFVLAFARALREAKYETAGDLLLVGNVGEEGPGNLRGIRHLFTQGEWKGKIGRFLSVDGGNLDLVTNGALGSLRYEITFRGPGGHSWGAFGTVSPAFAMGEAIAQLGRLKVTRSPKVTYNVGVLSGGTSVNSIPFSVAMEVDLRAVDPAALKQVDADLKRIVNEAVETENAARSTTAGRITAEMKLMGERPSGVTRPDTPAGRQVAATMHVFDKVPVWETSSTDANIPISLGIPAFAIARNSAGKSGRSHALDEWVDIEKTQGVKDFELAAALILTLAELP